MNGNRLRRVLSMALCALMLLTSFPAGVLGEGEGAPAPAVTTDEGQNIPGGGIALSAEPTVKVETIPAGNPTPTAENTSTATATAKSAPTAEATSTATATAETTPTAETTSTATATAESAPTAEATPTATATAEATSTATATVESAATAEATSTATAAPTPTADAPAAVIAQFLETSLSLEIEYGAPETDIGLPSALRVAYVGGAQGEVGVTWACVSDGLGGTSYVPDHEDRAGAVYTFEAILPDGVALAEGVALPTATARYSTLRMMMRRSASGAGCYVKDETLYITGTVDLNSVPPEPFWAIQVEEGGTITGGETALPVTNNGTITGGTFDAGLKNNGTIGGKDGSVLTLNGLIENRSAIYQPCTFGSGADIYNQGTTQVAMTVGGEEKYFYYGDNILASLSKHQPTGVNGTWRQVNENGTYAAVYPDDTFGLQKKNYQFTTDYYVQRGILYIVGEVDLDDVAVAEEYDRIIIEKAGTITDGTPSASVTTVQNVGTISGGTFDDIALNNKGTIQGTDVNAPTINGDITNISGGSILQPCNFGTDATVSTNAGTIEVAMTVGDEVKTYNYGANILSSLDGGDMASS